MSVVEVGVLQRGGHRPREGQGKEGERRPHHIARSVSLSPSFLLLFLDCPYPAGKNGRANGRRLRKYFVSRASILIQATRRRTADPGQMRPDVPLSCLSLSRSD